MAATSLQAGALCPAAAALAPTQSGVQTARVTLSALAPKPLALALRTSAPNAQTQKGLRYPFICAAAEEAVAGEPAAEDAADDAEGGSLGDSAEGKQRLLLKFVWLEKNIGIAVDQVVPGKGTVPLSPYMFWPRKDAWEELKNVLESKPWLPRRRMIILLNQATDVINLWQSQAYKQS